MAGISAKAPVEAQDGRLAHLERSLGGIPVESSYGFAALDSAGRVITEGVYSRRSRLIGGVRLDGYTGDGSDETALGHWLGQPYWKNE